MLAPVKYTDSSWVKLWQFRSTGLYEDILKVCNVLIILLSLVSSSIRVETSRQARHRSKFSQLIHPRRVGSLRPLLRWRTLRYRAAKVARSLSLARKVS